MQYLLDSDWAIQILNGIKPAELRVQELRPLGVAISAVSVGEIFDGVFGARDPIQREAALLDLLEHHEVLPVDATVARIFGRERRRLRLIGLPIDSMDILIAATALRHDLIMLTNNRQHFERFDGLVIESL